MTSIRVYRFLLVLVAGLLAVTPQTFAQVSSGTVLDEVAAVVGDMVILRSEVDEIAAQQAAGTEPAQSVTDALWSQVLDQLIAQRLLVLAAEEDTTLQVPEAYVNKQLESQIDALAQQAGSEEALANAYGITPDALRNRFRPEVRKQILSQQYRLARVQDVTITPSEVREWFAEIPTEQLPEVPEVVRLAQVVKKPGVSEATREATETRLEVLRDSVVRGDATIEEIANRHSEDPGNRNAGGSLNGGRYDNTRLQTLVSSFAAVASRLEEGEISPVFETTYGYHFMRLNNREGDRISFNHVLLEIGVDESGQEEALEKLSILRDSILTHDVPFEAIAQRHSDDPASRDRGGFVTDPQTGDRDLRLEVLGSDWQSTIRELEVGEISEPREVTLLDGTKGFHIVLLQRRTPPHTLSVEDDYALLSEYALEEKRQRVLEDVIDRLKRTFYVEIRSDRYQEPSTRS